MKERIQKTACETVVNRDLNNLVDLEKWVREANHRAESCKCPNCKKEAIAARQALDEYRNMVAHLHLVDIGKIPLVFANTRFYRGNEDV